MSRVVAFHSFRGGTGKSNTTANVAVMAARRGLRVGVIARSLRLIGSSSTTNSRADGAASCISLPALTADSPSPDPRDTRRPVSTYSTFSSSRSPAGSVRNSTKSSASATSSKISRERSGRPSF